ncbi:MAG: HAD family hydrolase, partial [Methanobacteriota archaeon]
MHVFLDLWGVVLDSERMTRGYRERLADLLRAQLGGTREAWLAAHDRAAADYDRKADALDWDAGEWLDLVDDLDAGHLLSILDGAGVTWKPAHPVEYARDLEFRVMAGVQARFPDARAAIERLRTAGHRVHLSTQATDSNARGALSGARLLEAFDRVFTGTTQKARKSRLEYWRTLPSTVGAPPGRCVVMDDRLEYLEPAASIGMIALLLDRTRRQTTHPLQTLLTATRRTQAGLRHLADGLW